MGPLALAARMLLVLLLRASAAHQQQPQQQADSPDAARPTRAPGSSGAAAANQSGLSLGFELEPEPGPGPGSEPMALALASPQFPMYMRVIATLACVIIFSVGVCGNLLVPLVVIKTKYLRNSTNLFLINLSIADLLVLIVCMPTVLIELHSRPETWLLGEPMCKLSNYVETLAANGSIFTILAISFERYYAICKPLKAGYKCTRLRASIIICAIWLLASVLTSPILIMAKSSETRYIDGSLVYNCILETDSYWPKMYVFVSMFAFFCLPLLVLMLVYWLISRRLIRDDIAMMQPQLQAHVGKRNSTSTTVTTLTSSAATTTTCCSCCAPTTAPAPAPAPDVNGPLTSPSLSSKLSIVASSVRASSRRAKLSAKLSSGLVWCKSLICGGAVSARRCLGKWSLDLGPPSVSCPCCYCRCCGERRLGARADEIDAEPSAQPDSIGCAEKTISSEAQGKRPMHSNAASPTMARLVEMGGSAGARRAPLGATCQPQADSALRRQILLAMAMVRRVCPSLSGSPGRLARFEWKNGKEMKGEEKCDDYDGLGAVRDRKPAGFNLIDQYGSNDEDPKLNLGTSLGLSSSPSPSPSPSLNLGLHGEAKPKEEEEEHEDEGDSQRQLANGRGGGDSSDAASDRAQAQAGATSSTCCPLASLIMVDDEHPMERELRKVLDADPQGVCVERAPLVVAFAKCDTQVSRDYGENVASASETSGQTSGRATASAPECWSQEGPLNPKPIIARLKSVCRNTPESNCQPLVKKLRPSKKCAHFDRAGENHSRQALGEDQATRSPAADPRSSSSSPSSSSSSSSSCSRTAREPKQVATCAVGQSAAEGELSDSLGSSQSSSFGYVGRAQTPGSDSGAHSLQDHADERNNFTPSICEKRASLAQNPVERPDESPGSQQTDAQLVDSSARSSELAGRKVFALDSGNDCDNDDEEQADEGEARGQTVGEERLPLRWARAAGSQATNVDDQEGSLPVRRRAKCELRLASAPLPASDHAGSTTPHKIRLNLSGEPNVVPRRRMCASEKATSTSGNHCKNSLQFNSADLTGCAEAQQGCELEKTLCYHHQIHHTHHQRHNHDFNNNNGHHQAGLVSTTGQPNQIKSNFITLAHNFTDGMHLKSISKRSGSQPTVCNLSSHNSCNHASGHLNHGHGQLEHTYSIRDSNKKQQTDSRRQVVVMLAFVVACFFLLFSPYRVFTIWLIFSTEAQVQSLGMEAYYNLTYFSRILIYLHSAINPIAYNLISTKFRRAFMSILLCRGPATRRHFTLDQHNLHYYNNINNNTHLLQHRGNFRVLQDSRSIKSNRSITITPVIPAASSSSMVSADNALSSLTRQQPLLNQTN